MAKHKGVRKSASQALAQDSDNLPNNVLSVANESVDPSLAALFQSSATLVKAAQKPQSRHPGKDLHGLQPGSGLQSLKLSSGHQKQRAQALEAEEHAVLQLKSRDHQGLSRKRARREDLDDLEGSYLDRLAREEAREHHQIHSPTSSKRQKVAAGQGDIMEIGLEPKRLPIAESGEASKSEQERILVDEIDESAALEQECGHEPRAVQHESNGASVGDIDIERASRTVFVGNVCTSTIKSKTAKSTFMQHLVSFVSSLPAHAPAHKVESLRFRSTPFSTSAIPKKAAFVKKELMDATTKSTNAYAVYSTPLAAREAVKKLNGSLCLERHIRVDSVAHPSKIDHKRCVFVGNLGFVDDPQAIDAAEDEESQKKPRKPREPADIEEGLWRTFSRAGKVANVRVIRDPITRVGKGFAYVQFEDPNAVEKALLLAGKKFPPMLPRILRVTRAKNIEKTASGSKEPKGQVKPSRSPKDSIHVSKPNPQQQSLSGRAGKLFGRAGAAKLRGTGSNTTTLGRGGSMRSGGINRAPAATPLVFEGYRASSAGNKGAKVVRRKGKPQTRSSKRATAFRSGGFKKKRAKAQE